MKVVNSNDKKYPTLTTADATAADATAANAVRHRLSCILAGGLALSMLVPSSAWAANAEAKVKTAYLYTFMRSVTWPADAFDSDTDPLVVSILGKDSLGGLLDMVAAKKTINKRKIRIVRLDTPSQYQPSHILYVTGSPSKDVRKTVLEKTQGSNVLLVGEVSGFAKQGAAVNFFPDADGTIGFEVNQDAASRHKLKLSDKVLQIGTVVTN